MLTKERKIPLRARISHILAKGSRDRFTLFSVRMLPNRSNFSRFAVVVSGKVSKTAVGRNRIRRQLYEAIRTQLKTGKSSLPQKDKTCYDVVVFANPQAKSASFADIDKEVQNLIHNI